MMHPHRILNGRRGNALVLVSAMLVLLTLIAAAYLTRTRSQRVTASAMQETAGGTRRSDIVGKQLAEEIALHLFVKPIDPTGAGNFVGGDSAGNRLPPPTESVRYGIESAPPRIGGGSPADRMSNVLDPAFASSREPGDTRRLVGGSDGFPDGFNYAPYAVIPWTNWPDFTAPVTNPNSGSPAGTPWWYNGGTAVSGDIYGNPLGNPGFGDTRWLRSTEPVRAADIGTPTARNFVATPGGAFFSHWPHLSWIPTATNRWRLVTDIGDIENSLRQEGMGSNLDGFGTPYEQWLPNVVPLRIPVTAAKPTDADAGWVSEFTKRRNAWFTRSGYQAAILPQANSLMLPNFIKLDDPLGIGRTNDPDADPVPPSDEYITNTPRNIVARTFCDADGDGFTDSFWFLAPTGKERNVRTVVGVSVIDNASMLDLNVATRFDRRTTVGFTPADLALVTAEPELAYTAAPSLNFARTDTRAGLFDNESNFRFGNVDPRDPSDGGNPAGFKTPQTSSIGFGMAFDPYRYAGRPTPQDPNVSPRHDDGSPSMLQSLGVRMTDPKSTAASMDARSFWSPYFYGAPGMSLNMGPWLGFQMADGPQVDVFGPGGPSRPQQSDPLVQVNGNWEPYFRYLWGTLKRDDINGPFMRPDERTRWFQTAMAGEMRIFAPFTFGVGATAQTVEALEVYPGAGGARDIGGRPIRIKPFDAADEVELRAFAGNNDSTNMSRLERSLNSDDLVRDKTFEILDTVLRSTVLRSEGGPGGAQLTNAQLVRDLRHKLTVVSSQRNELMPPWLWTGRPYLVSGPNQREQFQNATLWLGLHPDTPGARDENNDGRVDGQELQWGVYDLWRASATANGDIFPDNVFPTFSATNAAMDARDWKRGVSLFEYMNRKLDLRRPLLVTTGSNDESGFRKMRYAYSIPEERRAMIEFAKDARQRLRPALRTHSLQRNQLDWSNVDISTEVGQPTIEALGPFQGGTYNGPAPVSYASYTDRFIDQLRTGLDARVAESADATIAAASSQPTVATDTTLYAWRSAWSTEAMTASMAANLSTWRSRPTLIRELSADPAFAGKDFGLRPVWQPILPNIFPNADPTRPGFGPTQRNWNGLDYTDRTTGYGREKELAPAQALRAVDPSKPGAAIPNATYPTSPWSNPGEETADVVFPGIEKHPFLTECFFGWVYPATTTDVSGVIKPAVVNLKDCPTTPSNNFSKFVAVVNGKIGTDGAVINQNAGTAGSPPSVDSKRDEMNEIRTPLLVVQVANPWNEPIRLGDFRLEIFGQRYDFPDYELDASGNVILDANGKPVPLMLNAGSETAPVTATVYLIANVLGNAANDSNVSDAAMATAQGDLAKVAQWDPWFRRRWLDYFDLYELLDKPDVDTVQGAGSWMDPQPKATSPNAWPLYRNGSALPQSKLLNAMQADADPTKVRITDLRVFRDELTPDNLKRGIVLQRVLRDPSARTAAELPFKKNLARWNQATSTWQMASAEETQGMTLEVDRFDADPSFDHFSTKVTAAAAGANGDVLEMFKNPDANFDTNLVTGGRFWSACARITLPPEKDISPQASAALRDLAALIGAPIDPLTTKPYTFEEPAGIRGCFPPPTAKILVRPASDPFECASINPSTGQPQGDSAQPPTQFPGIILGDSTNTTGRDYFTTWTHVARSWSRLFDAQLATLKADGVAANGGNGRAALVHPAPLVAGATSNLPVWGWTQQMVDASFASANSNVIPNDRKAPRFVFAARSEPDSTMNPNRPKRIELDGFQANPDATEVDAAKIAKPGSVPAVEETALGDIFRLDATASPQDPDTWSPVIGNSTWLADTTDFGWLTTPVWAPLPDFSGLTATTGTPATTLATGNYPELILRKPFAFACQTVVDPQPGRSDAATRRLVAYYGDATRTPGPSGNPVNTRFVTPEWATPPGGTASNINSAFTRIYMADKGARLLDHNGKLLQLVMDTGRPDPTKHVWNLQGVWNTLARIPQAKSMQMLQKDDDFEQVGELLDVFLWGPSYRIGSATEESSTRVTPGKLRASSIIADAIVGNPSRLVPQCRATFAEIMTGRVPGMPVGEGSMVNRLQVDPPNLAFSGSSVWQYAGNPALRMPYAPAVPWGMRVFDAFTLDGSGAASRYDWSDRTAGANIRNWPANTTGTPVFENSAGAVTGSSSYDTRQDNTAFRPVGSLLPPDAYRYPTTTGTLGPVTRTTLAQWEVDRSPMLSAGFAGKGVKGLLNINTAPLEVLSTLPHMTQLIYDDSGRVKDSTSGYTDGSPVTGPTPVGTDDTFDLSLAPSAGRSQNPTNLFASSLEIYRDRLNPSHLLQGKAPTDVSAYVPDVANPLAVRAGKTPTHPTYADRGDPVPAGSFAGAAALAADRSFVGPNSTGSSRIANVNVPFNRGMRAARGFETIGELTGLARTTLANPALLGAAGAGFPDWQYDQAWSVRLAGRDPYRFQYAAGADGDGYGQGWYAGLKKSPGEALDARVSTDRQGVRAFNFVNASVPADQITVEEAFSLSPDSSYGDSEEQNLLFKGISNLITTRSDVFTVYFRIRTVKQDPTTGGWNGVDPDSVLEDARYVMCVDRSNVNRPTDQPRIVYFSRVSE